MESDLILFASVLRQWDIEPSTSKSLWIEYAVGQHVAEHLFPFEACLESSSLRMGI